MGRALHVRLKAAYESWKETRDDKFLVADISDLAQQFGKADVSSVTGPSLKPGDLELVCFEYVTG